MSEAQSDDGRGNTGRSPLRRKLRYILLIALLILNTYFLGAHTIQAYKYMTFNRMLDQRFQVASLVNILLINSLVEPGERLTRSVSNDINAETATWARDYPDLIGVHTVAGKNITNYLMRATSPVYQKVIEQTALPMQDTLRFFKCTWDSTCQVANQWINIEDQHLLCSFFRTPTQTFLVVRDTEKLKQGISGILDECRRGLHTFDYYFQPSQRFGAQIKFFDEGYNNFCTYGNPTGKGWERIQEQRVPFLPWKMKVQVFDQHQPSMTTFMEDKIWWYIAFHWVIGVVCVLLLGWWGRGYAWAVRTSGEGEENAQASDRGNV